MFSEPTPSTTLNKTFTGIIYMAKVMQHVAFTLAVLVSPHKQQCRRSLQTKRIPQVDL